MERLADVRTNMGQENMMNQTRLRVRSGNTFGRQVLLLAAAMLVFSLLASHLMSARPAFAAASSHFRTTTPLNLRAEPSLSAKVLLIMPAEALVLDAGSSANGFISVEYNGTSGWAFGDYLASTNPDAAPPLVGKAVTTSDVNLRQGPDLTTTVKLVVPDGRTVQTSDTVIDGFRYVSSNGEPGWIFDEYLSASGVRYEPGSTMETTTVLNLREMPSMDSTVFLVMPKGAQVMLGAQSGNGFRIVTYNGITGWAYESYLA
jgi:uncharacterized protein YraI